MSVLEQLSREPTTQLIEPTASWNHVFFALNTDKWISGTQISGVVVLVVQKPIKATKISINWDGSEYTSWYQGTSLSVHCTASRMIFSKSIAIWTSETDKVNNGDLKAGTYTIPFVWDLPSNLPSSYSEVPTETGGLLSNLVIPSNGLIIPKSTSGTKSRILYTARAVVESDHPNLDYGIQFHVSESFNPEVLNFTPIVKETQKTPYFSKGAIKMKATLPTNGICFLGYALPVMLEVANGSHLPINTLKFIFKKTTILNANGETFIRKTDGLSGMVPGIKIPAQGFYVENVYAQVLPMLEPSISIGVLIQRKYQLHIELEIGGYTGGTLSLDFDVQIYEPNGHPYIKSFIPISAIQQQQQQEKTTSLARSTSLNVASKVAESPPTFSRNASLLNIRQPTESVSPTSAMSEDLIAFNSENSPSLTKVVSSEVEP